MYDRTRMLCKIFSGQLVDLRADCGVVGYPKKPNHATCDEIFDEPLENSCLVRFDILGVEEISNRII